MNPQYEKQLEASIRRELDTLGELSAPPALANRILREIERRAATPWYRRAWPNWPASLRLASLLLLVGAFSGLFFGTWELTHALSSTQSATDWWTGTLALWRSAGALGRVACSFTDYLSPALIFTALGLFFAACATCVGLGSACLRLAVRPNTDSLSS